MKNVGLLSPYKLGTIDLKNRIVMVPMTRSRAMSNIPNELMAEFYGQRAAAGLIITEGNAKRQRAQTSGTWNASLCKEE